MQEKQYLKKSPGSGVRMARDRFRTKIEYWDGIRNLEPIRYEPLDSCQDELRILKAEVDTFCKLTGIRGENEEQKAN